MCDRFVSFSSDERSLRERLDQRRSLILLGFSFFAVKTCVSCSSLGLLELKYLWKHFRWERGKKGYSMFHSQLCQHLGVCAILPRDTSPMALLHPAAQMETSLTSLHRLTIWLILFSDQAKPSLFSAASFILFSLFLSPCCPHFSALAPFAFFPPVCSSVCCPLVCPWCLKLLLLPRFVAHTFFSFPQIHYFTSFSPNSGLKTLLRKALDCLQMWFPRCRVT